MISAALTLVAALALAVPPEEKPKPSADHFRPDPAWKVLGPSLWFDPKERRLVIRARVVLREGPLEHLLCLKGTKEHEAILATAAVPRQITAGLFLTGAEKGEPVKFLPQFVPPTGSPIAIELEWEADGKIRRTDAREWVWDEKAKKPLDRDWVFAGSELLEDPVTRQKVYAADDGDLITVANFSSAILDLPFASTANDADRIFAANTDHIPPRGTLVTLYLRPRKPPQTKERIARKQQRGHRGKQRRGGTHGY